MKLSKNFSLAELTRSATATRLGIANNPSMQNIANLRMLANDILEPVRESFGVPFSPQSGFRCLKLNRVLGSADTSQHVTGNAVDFEVPTVSNFALAMWIKDNLKFDQLILEFHHKGYPKSGWVHVSKKTERNRNQCLIFDGTEYKEF